MMPAPHEHGAAPATLSPAGERRRAEVLEAALRERARAAARRRALATAAAASLALATGAAALIARAPAPGRPTSSDTSPSPVPRHVAEAPATPPTPQTHRTASGAHRTERPTNLAPRQPDAIESPAEPASRIARLSTAASTTLVRLSSTSRIDRPPPTVATAQASGPHATRLAGHPHSITRADNSSPASVARLGDRELLDALAEAGISAGLARAHGRVLVTGLPAPAPSL